jgi:hypothetical protein
MYKQSTLLKVKEYLKRLYTVSYDQANTSTIENVRLYVDPQDGGSMFVAYVSKWKDSDYIAHEEDIVVCFNAVGEIEDCCKKYNLCGLGVTDFLATKKQINI